MAESDDVSVMTEDDCGSTQEGESVQVRVAAAAVDAPAEAAAVLAAPGAVGADCIAAADGHVMLLLLQVFVRVRPTNATEAAESEL